MIFNFILNALDKIQTMTTTTKKTKYLDRTEVLRIIRLTSIPFIVPARIANKRERNKKRD